MRINIDRKSEILIYPNPTSNIINIILPASIKTSQLELINMQGAVVKSVERNEQKFEINTIDVYPGFYMIRISTDETIFMEKILILK